MKKDIIVTAKTIEEAAQNGATQLGVAREDVEIEVLEEPKKGFLGMGAAPAKVKVTYILKPLEAARNFIETLMNDLGITADIQIHDDGDGESLITIEGEGASILIGHHGDTLEAFQYLVNLAANKKDDEDRQYTRITVNIENYREKREETLRKLAVKMASKVKKSGRNIALEPMNAYERRIIHAEIQKIEGVSTNSVGAEGNRRVVIFPEGMTKPTEAKPERKPRPRREKPAFKKTEKRAKPADKTEKPVTAPESDAQTERQDAPRREQPRRDYSAYKRPEGSRPAPRKVEKAKDLDSYFAKLKEFSSNNGQQS